MQTLKKTADWGSPEEWIDLPVEKLFSLTSDETESLQLKWFSKRFKTLESKISAVKALAEKQGVTSIDEVNDIAPLLFTHKVYKSYPLSLIEKKKFNHLTGWLDKLTSHDLSGIDVSDIKTIDGWLDQMDSDKMYLCHSTGTTGKLSFFPRSQTEKRSFLTGMYNAIEASSGKDIRKEQMPVFFPGYRGGYQVSHKVLHHVGMELGFNGEEFHTLFDKPMSADFMSLAGRLKAAKASGSLKKMDMIKALVKSKGELIKLKKQQPIMMEAYMNKLVNEYKGQKVLIMATTPDLLKAAEAGLKEGNSKIFSSDSILITGGGLKGYDAPEDWPSVLKEFYGVDEFYTLYGMTECTAILPMCKNGHYHVYPYLIPFVLDVETGEALPRKGTQTGRYGFYDLLAETYWGGLLTGDKVTVHYDDCGCGWKGAWLEDNIMRYSELQEDREDKISCSGSQDAYNEFLDFIVEDAVK
jgi:hypothetical protein